MSGQDLKYTETHEWLRVEGGEATIGLSDYAQGELGDIVFIELPEVGRGVAKGDVLSTIESVKSVSEIYAPVTGEIADVNTALDADPGLINTDAQGEGWIFRIKLTDEGELAGLMDSDQYADHTKG
jgi:glycine cleavage system H protein